MKKILIVLLGLLICLYLRASYIEVRAKRNYIDKIIEFGESFVGKGIEV